jgi:hypothetical protein
VVWAVGVLSGVLSGAAPEPARRVVASRALLAVEEWLFPLHEELVLAENADAAAGAATDEEVELSPFARRLRLLQEAAAKTAVGLGGDVGVGAHQIGFCAADRSRPGSREREALAGALGVHPAWLHASRDEQPDMQLYRFASCPCEKPAAMARLSLGREEPDWYDSPAEQDAAVQDAAVHWCGGCGQSWVKDAAGWLLPLPSGKEPTPSNGDLARLGHPLSPGLSVTLEEPWPRALWQPPAGRKGRARTAYRRSPDCSPGSRRPCPYGRIPRASSCRNRCGVPARRSGLPRTRRGAARAGPWSTHPQGRPAGCGFCCTAASRNAT